MSREKMGAEICKKRLPLKAVLSGGRASVIGLEFRRRENAGLDEI
jgi:hypothetical protein